MSAKPTPGPAPGCGTLLCPSTLASLEAAQASLILPGFPQAPVPGPALGVSLYQSSLHLEPRRDSIG